MNTGSATGGLNLQSMGGQRFETVKGFVGVAGHFASLDRLLRRSEPFAMLTLYSCALRPGITSPVQWLVQCTGLCGRIEDILRYIHDAIGGRSATLAFGPPR